MKTIFHNGNIITMDPARESAQAVCVEGKKICGVGTDAEMLALKEQDSHLVDLEGKTLLPGFFETHMHILSYGMLLKDINHNSCDSIAALIEHSKKHIATNRIPDGTWVRGRGWNQDSFGDENRFINRYDLDAVSTTHPLAFMRTCGHVIVVNSCALEIMGMAESAPEIPGGQIDLDAAGKPLGIFREQARRCVLDCIPEKTKDEIKELICLATDDAVAHGIVEIHSDDFKDVPSNYQKVIDAFSELVAEDRLKIRVYEQCNLPSVG
ncbi:amidohydrolase family protein, partial [Ruminococcaceae bacterium OttesenSCG-928-D13]|nr:amidohydrolase family protein [Ruminococcaceae bacterium OttesenSCG-928-D13]